MKAKKIVALVAAAAMVLSMAACGSADNSSSDAKDGSAAAETTTKSSDSDTLVMATNATFPPYEYVDGDDYKGIDIEIAQAIADAMGKKLEVDDIDFDSIIPAITTGKADMSLAGMTVTDERKQNVDFSDTYATGVQVIIVPEDSDITGPDDLADKMIGVQQGTTGHIYCSDTPENGGFGEDHVTAYPNGASAIQALQTGKVDAVVIDNEPAKAFVAENPGLKILDTEYVTEDYAIAVKKGNTELLDQINEILAKLKADGTLQSIIDKYIKAE